MNGPNVAIALLGNRGLLVSTSTLRHWGLWFESQPGHCMEFASSSCLCVGFLRVLEFPLTLVDRLAPVYIGPIFEVEIF